jgi:2-hydroxy-6-oxonona-2,4-dienedioate hydrolase
MQLSRNRLRCNSAGTGMRKRRLYTFENKREDYAMLKKRLHFVALLAATLPVSAQIPPSILPAMNELPPLKTELVFGQRIAYYEIGSGPALVLVHGFATQARFDWGRVMAPLAAHHHVIALDQIGFGHSDKPAVDYSIQTFVDFLGEFLRVKHVERFDLAGESLGGWIVANYTIQALSPANHGAFKLPVPSKLILEDAAGHRVLAGNAHVAGSLAEAAGIAIVFHNKSLVTDDLVRRSFEMKLSANDGQTEKLFTNNPKLASETVQGKLGAITIPTLVVWGGNDELVPLSDGQDYAAKIVNAELVIVPECGHAPSIEKPEQFLSAVEQFLR